MTEDRQGRVLVVEDNEVNQALTVAILAKLGYRSEVVDDGREAVEVVPRGGYEAVLMDCQLPVPPPRSAAVRGRVAARRSSR